MPLSHGYVYVKTKLGGDSPIGKLIIADQFWNLCKTFTALEEKRISSGKKQKSYRFYQ